MDRDLSRSLEYICLFLLLVVVGLRPLISETYDSAGLALTSVLPGIEDPSPVTTLLIDGVIMLAAVGWLIGRWRSKDRSYRWCGIEWGVLLIAVAAVVSCIFAGNKRLAINGAVDWLSCALLGIVLAQLLRERWRVQLALCVVVASAGAQAVESFHQVFYSFGETEEMYEANREAIWAGQGVALDSPEVELFERRLRGHEASGFLSHSNVAGAYLVMCGLAAAAIGVSRWTFARWQALPALFVSGVILTAGALTHSKGALIAGAAAIVLWVVRSRFDSVISRHSRAMFRWGWAVVVLATLAVVGHGLWHGSLPSRSLDFRWQYWTASAEMVADRPLTGVGRGNFGRHYLQYKTIESPEEVKNPHNFLVSAAADWGLGGLLGMVLMLVGASRVVTGWRGRSEHMPGADATSSDGELGRSGLLLWGVLLAAGIFLPRVTLLGNDDPDYLFFATMLPLLAWGTTYVLIGLGPIGRMPSLSIGLAFALFAFVLQDTINFASIVPATLTTVFALLGIVVADRNIGRVTSANHTINRPGWWAVVCGAVLMMCVWLVVMPVLRADGSLRQARASVDPRSAYESFVQAAALDRLDPTALYEASRTARFLASQDGGDAQWAEKATHCQERYLSRDPFNIATLSEEMMCARLRAELATGEGRFDYWSRAVRAAEGIVERYPSGPSGYVALADCLSDFGAVAADRALLSKAIEAYKRALELDDARPEWETIRRMRPAEREAIASRIVEVRYWVGQLADDG